MSLPGPSRQRRTAIEVFGGFVPSRLITLRASQAGQQELRSYSLALYEAIYNPKIGFVWVRFRAAALQTKVLLASFRKFFSAKIFHFPVSAGGGGTGVSRPLDVIVTAVSRARPRPATHKPGIRPAAKRRRNSAQGGAKRNPGYAVGERQALQGAGGLYTHPSKACTHLKF